jgi:cobalt-zinc-cadmium efflux system protein
MLVSSGHHHHETDNDRSLVFAVGLNLLLTICQFIGGIVSGSLSLIADALHNLSDATSLGIALFARKISRKPPDELKTFGYQRAEVIAALINLTLLIAVCVYLIYEAIWRIVEPQVVTGWIIVLLAAIALIVDMVTAFITYLKSKNNLNMQAAFLHNLSDALASIGVIFAGTLIILYEWYWVDTAVTFLIAGFISWQAMKLLPKTIHLLMEGTPEDLSSKEVKRSLEAIEGVEGVHHIHIWHLDEHRIALEAHVVVIANELKQVEVIKDKLKELLNKTFGILHSTLEFEHHIDASCDERLEGI